MRFYHRFVDETLDDNGTLQQFSLHYPDNFNFGYDVVDAIADEAPQRRALVWCNQRGDERIFTFSEIKELSNRAANFFRAQGVKQGDRVMVMLKRHHEYWYTIVGLHKLGAVVIPATHMLTTKDMEYRINAVGIRTVVVTGEDGTAEALAHCKCASLQNKIIVHGSHPGFVDFAQGIAEASPELERVPTKVTDPFLLYFTSGTTGQPKAVMHDFTYPLGHVITARHWQNVRDGGLHLSVSDTGWGKASWGKIYGQWLSGAAVMVYDYDQFNPHKLMEVVQKYGVDTFCAPPTVFRYLVKRKVPNGMFSSVQYAVTAGEALNPEIAVKFQEQTGLTLHEGFGQTESVLMVGNLVGMPVRPGSMGKPSPLYHIELLKEDGTYAKDGEEGEMVVVPPENGVQHGVFMGYDGDEDLYRWVWRGGVRRRGPLPLGLARLGVPHPRHCPARQRRLLLVLQPHRRCDQVQRLPHQPLRGRERAHGAPSRHGVRRRRCARSGPRRRHQGLYCPYPSGCRPRRAHSPASALHGRKRSLLQASQAL